MTDTSLGRHPRADRPALSSTAMDGMHPTGMHSCSYFAVADLRGGTGDARPLPRGSKFFRFHAVFGKFWQNRMLAPPLGSWRPLLGEILDPPLFWIQ